jgi:hypothetical protein
LEIFVFPEEFFFVEFVDGPGLDVGAEVDVAYLDTVEELDGIIFVIESYEV